ncbi:PKC1 [Malassezia furfur]|nr:PKC1 [Malassezia furfur]
MQSSTSSRIEDVQARIQKQRRMIEGFQTLRNATPNPDVIRQAESNIRNAQQTISYLEESLHSLQTRSSVDMGAPPPVSSSPTARRSMTPMDASVAANAGRRMSVQSIGTQQPGYPIDSSAAYRSGAYAAYGVPGSVPDVAPASDGALQRDETMTRRNYTNLDLMKCETPLTHAKITRMIEQLEHKLQLERQYKQGFEKIAKLYQVEGDRRSMQDAERRYAESASKLVLIQQALKRYMQLNVLDPDETKAEEENVYANRRARKPQTGTLSISIKAVKDIDHAAMPSGVRSGRESYIALKIEDTERVQTQASRIDQWNEDFQLPIDNANEIELIVYDRVGSAQPVPVGLVWIKISDLVDQLRRKKFGQVGGPESSPAQSPANAQSGEWVTADRMRQEPLAPTIDKASGSDAFYNTPAGQLVPTKPVESGIEGWFTVEPIGAILLKLNFVKQNVQKRPYDARLGRQGALRKRREDVSEVNGHKFVQRQFYQMIRCALCGEILLNAAGSQCQDCNYTCHRKCAQKVVTKCISKSNTDPDRDEVKLNHRIPHRWEPFTNLGANWCCHCGYMLPLGRRTNRKCSECDLTCHADCAHLVPDFCGMSMEMANQLLSNIATINKDARRAARPSRRPRTTPAGAAAIPTLKTAAPGVSPSSSHTQLAQGMQAMHLAPDAPRHTGPPSPTTPSGQAAASAAAAARRHRRGARGARRGAHGHAAAAPPSPAHDALARAAPPLPRAPRAGSLRRRRADAAANRLADLDDVRTERRCGAARGAGGRAPGGVVPSPHKVVAQATAPPASSTVPMPASSQRKVTLNDFNFLAVLGKGNFGKVMLAEEKTTGTLYAIKVLKKEFIIENDEIDSTRSEKRVFLTAAREQHPFLLGLHSCFQTETRVYFVMEYVSGGDLMLHIQREQFNLHRAKFYAAEVLLALEYFHKHGIIYRDLKLDNIMLTLDGHIKIADYGLCKEGMWYGNTTSTFCGTPEFMAPEILLEQRYSRAVDWWAFGILLYEMLLGQAPFRGDDEDEIFDAILEDEPLYPIQMPRESVSLLQRLLTRDPARRLGAGPNDADEVKAHPFFRDVNWDDLLHKRVPPPFCPTLKNASDTTWFDTEFTSEKPTLTPVHSVFSAKDQAEFRDFSWTAPHVL